MIEVFRIPVPKAKLAAMPPAERVLLLLITHAVNQLTTLMRLLIFSTNHETSNELENTLSAAQSQAILRFLFGTVSESWEMLRRPENQNLIGTDYIQLMPAAGVESYKKLKKLFGKSNFLHRIRNNLVFHFPCPETVEAAFSEVPDDQDWAWYASTTYSNSFYLASDYIISAGIIKETGEPDVAMAFCRVMDEVMLAADKLTDFCSHLAKAMIARHLDAALLSPKRGSGTKIHSAPRLKSVSIPFFTIDDRLSRSGVASGRLSYFITAPVIGHREPQADSQNS